MRVFVAGATGALGRSLLPRLAEAGHAVIGLTRRPEKKRLIQQLGGEATVADGLDAKAIRKADEGEGSSE
jgi:nucleoside-diphosphate-sugar epimerase